MPQQMHFILAISINIRYAELLCFMRCNLVWAEIERPLLPGHVPQNSPELAVRVFVSKLRFKMSNETV